MTAGPAVRGPVKGFTQNFVFTWRTTAGTQTSVINRRNMFCVDGSAATEDINTFTLCSWCGAAAWAVTATWRTELTVRHLLTDEGRIKRQDERGEIERMISRVHDWIKACQRKVQCMRRQTERLHELCISQPTQTQTKLQMDFSPPPVVML